MSRRGSSGFALPLALAGIALVSLSVLALARVESGRLREIRALREKSVADLAVATAEARVAYLLATEPLGARAINVARGGDGMRGGARVAPVVLDGRPYALDAGVTSGVAVVVRLQDEAGLVNLNRTDPEAVARLLGAIGVDVGAARQLAARLADAIDDDELVRPEGAERRAYERAGVAPPRNARFDDARQSFAVLGWDPALSREQAHAFMDETVSLALDAPVNPNTATARTLQSVFGVDANTAQRVIASRETQLLLSADDVMQLTGADEFRSQLRAFPARSLRLSIQVTTGPSQEICVYVGRIGIAEQGAEMPIVVRRTDAPMRAYPKERAHIDAWGELDILPQGASQRAARNR